MKILILCTGNTCRSQMAEAFLKSYNPNLEVFSAGTNAEKNVNPHAVKVMEEIKIDISKQYPEHVDKYLEINFDWLITVCDGAKEICPAFTGTVSNRLHIGFDDPAATKGTEEEVLPTYRRVRDEIIEQFSKLGLFAN